MWPCFTNQCIRMGKCRNSTFIYILISRYPTIRNHLKWHYNDVIMGVVASQITSLTIVYSTAYSGADQRKHQSPASLAFVRGIHRSPVNSPHREPVTRSMFPFDVVIMSTQFFRKSDTPKGSITQSLIPHRTSACSNWSAYFLSYVHKEIMLSVYNETSMSVYLGSLLGLGTQSFVDI